MATILAACANVATKVSSVGRTVGLWCECKEIFCRIKRGRILKRKEQNGDPFWRTDMIHRAIRDRCCFLKQ